MIGSCDPKRRRAWARPGGAHGVGAVILLGLGAAALAPLAAARDVVRVESVGVAPVQPDSASARDSAVRRALLDAVRQTAEGLLATPTGDGFDEAWESARDPASEASERDALQHILGDEPLEYATRFQVVEDRGAGPALFGSDPGVETEYVVIVSVLVDRDRIRERLTRAGLPLAPAGQAPRIRSRLILENLEDYWVYAEIRRVLLEELGVREAIPREFSPGRGVLELTAAQYPDEFLDSLQRAVAERMDLQPLSDEADELRVRVELYETRPPWERSEEADAIDTRSPKRY